MTVIDITGQRFGRLTALEQVGVNVHRKALWRCQCECGKQITTEGKKLRTGHTKSCGCYAIDRIRETKTTHGHKPKSRASPTYISWSRMHARCESPDFHAYHRYGGRGITVCERWSSFENFLADMGERPNGMTLDRIRVDGNYEPGNCRWADRITQAHNKA